MICDETIPDSEIIMILEKKYISYTRLMQVSKKENKLLQSFPSLKVKWSDDERYVFYLDKRKLVLYQIKGSRKISQTIFISDIIKMKGKLIFTTRNNNYRLYLQDLNRGKVIRSFICMNAIIRSIRLIQNKIFFQQKYYRHKIYYYDFTTGQSLIANENNDNLTQFFQSFNKFHDFKIQISKNGQFIALKSELETFIFTEKLKLITSTKQFYYNENYKKCQFSECSQYLVFYDLKSFSRISVFHIEREITQVYHFNYKLKFVKLKDKILHIIRIQKSRMIYVKIPI